MRELGYDNLNAILNLSTISILLLIYFVRVVVYLILQSYRKFKAKREQQLEGGEAQTQKPMFIKFAFKKSNRNRLKKSKTWCIEAIDRMAQTLFYYEIMRLFLEGYLEFVVSSWLNFFVPDRSTASTVFGCIFAVIILVICLVILPFLSVYILIP